MKRVKLKLKDVIISLVSLLLIAFVVLLIWYNIAKKINEKNIEENEVNNVISEEEMEAEDFGGDFIKSDDYTEVKSPTSFYTVEGFIQDFLTSIKSLNNSNSDATKLLSILDEDYITENSITSDNIKNKLSKYGTYTYTVTNMYEYGFSDTLYTFLVEGEFSSAVDGQKEFYIYFELDYESGGYKIRPATASDSSFVNENEIELNDYNVFSNTSIDSITMCNKYLEMFANSIEEDLNGSYELLDEDYAKARFGSTSNYANYIKENKELFTDFEIDVYKLNFKDDGSREYIMVDSYERYIIVEATSVMNYTIMLDSYTIPLSETVERYDEMSVEKQACMCIELTKEMINNKDYQSIYNHLNSTFAQNNFSSVDDLQEFIEDTFYEFNTFEYETYDASSGNYVVKVKVSNSDDDEDYFETDFVIKLGDEISDFEMSFNIE